MEAGPEDDAAEAGSAGASLASGAADGAVGPLGGYTPLWRAQHEARYLRQRLIREYQAAYDCSLAVMIDQITYESVTSFAEVLHNHPADRDLHLMLCSPGGDGETAVRLARMAQASSRRFVVVVPELAKSAATILALGAHEIIMGPTSDLGPIDPQVLIPGRGFVGAKDLIAAVDTALADVAARRDTYPLHAAMLAGVDSTTVQFARSAQARTDDIARIALANNPDRNDAEVERMFGLIKPPLIDTPKAHGAVVGCREAHEAGLPVVELGPSDRQWQDIWALWTRYFAIGPVDRLSVYEGERASQVHHEPPAG